MIIELLLTMFFGLIEVIITLIPTFSIKNFSLSPLINVIGVGISILPNCFFPTLIVTVLFWTVTHLVWSAIEWLYKKIPGVD